MKIDDNTDNEHKWKPLKVHSVDDVVKAGGPDAYARKIGHIPLVLQTDIPAIEFTDEEWAELEELMRNDR